jgi:peptide/nickel transport system ATP-binding protein
LTRFQVHLSRNIMGEPPLLSVSGLRKHFKVRGAPFSRNAPTVHAVDGISFHVDSQETLGIVGESGCGKSTTGRLLVQLIEADEGRIVYGDTVFDAGEQRSKSALRRQIQMVFQDSYGSLNPRLPALATVAFGPWVHGASPAEAQRTAANYLSLVGLAPEQFGHRFPHELSGGQRQRVNIARALAISPSMVILDEAVSALDKSVEAQILNLLIDLKARLSLTYILISHDLNAVRYMSNRIMVMYLGTIVELGPVERIYGEPAHPYTRALLSAMPSMDPDRRFDRPPIAGDPPTPINPPPGCRFASRCPFARELCTREAPALKAIGGEPGTSGQAPRQVACHMVQRAGVASATFWPDSDSATGKAR